MMKKCLILFLVFTIGCINKTRINQPTTKNNDALFNKMDSIVYKGDSTNVFSDFLFPVTLDSDRSVSFDLMTNDILVFNKKKCCISTISLQSKIDVFKLNISRLIGILEIDKNNYLLCTDPYFLIVDSSLNLKKSIKINFEITLNQYLIVGDILNFQLSNDRKFVYFTIEPFHLSNSKANPGRIMEVNLEDGSSRVLPVKQPCDYSLGKDYKMFTIPNFTVFNNQLFYIFPGSNYLYNYNLESSLTDSVYISPKYVDINVKEVGSKMEDLIFSYLECNNFYQIINNQNIILLFYWEGQERHTYNKQKGLKEINCYILGYDPSKKEILFDSPLRVNNILKKAYKFENETLYFPYQGDYQSNSIVSKLMMYEIKID